MGRLTSNVLAILLPNSNGKSPPKPQGLRVPPQSGRPLGGGTLPLYEMKDGKNCRRRDDAERVRLIYQDISNRRGQRVGARTQRKDIRTNNKGCAPTGATYGGSLRTRIAVLSVAQRLYIGEVKYKDKILPGEQHSDHG